MQKHNYPVPHNELERLLSLSELDMDFRDIDADFKDLTKLAAKIAGTEVSLINLIDSYTQWTVASYGTELKQMDREDSVCQYTIMADNHFEVEDLKAHHVFKDKFYVQDPTSYRYYLGVPLKDKQGFKIGALCVLNTQLKSFSPEKTEMLKLIANEIVNRLSAYKIINQLKENLNDVNLSHKKVAHDIRSPLSGIIGLSGLITNQGSNNSLDEVLDIVNLIHKSSKSLLDLADEILTEGQANNQEFNLGLFKSKLVALYSPQAKNKDLDLAINVSENTLSIPFSKGKLIQIAGNLIANAVKFTQSGGKITVDIYLSAEADNRKLSLTISDTGCGISPEIIDQILRNNTSSTDGTMGEKGYGLGLILVKHLVDSLNGSLQINSKPEIQGTTFKVEIPFN